MAQKTHHEDGNTLDKYSRAYPTKGANQAPDIRQSLSIWLGQKKAVTTYLVVTMDIGAKWTNAYMASSTNGTWKTVEDGDCS